MKKAIDVKINIRPVYSNLVHTDIWEGPCRVGSAELLDPAYEKRAGLEQFSMLKERLEANLDLRFCHIMDPVYIEWDESFVVRDEQLDQLNNQLQESKGCVSADEVADLRAQLDALRARLSK